MGKVSDKVNGKRKSAAPVVPPVVKRDRCGQCANWDIEGRPPGMGLCRAKPPQLIMEGEAMRAFWPVLNKDEWCGVFKPAVDSSAT